MISDLPTPLTPADCDLRNFPFMPVDVLRLRDSDTAALEDAEAFRASVMAWCASWHQVPAASLSDNDAVLCWIHGYGRDIKKWRRVRAAGGLHGWIKCSDGRLYHPVVAEKARKAWTLKSKQREKGVRANSVRWKKNAAETKQAIENTDGAVSLWDAGCITSAIPGDPNREDRTGTVQEDSTALRAVTTPKVARQKPRSHIPPDWRPDDTGLKYAWNRGVSARQEVPSFRNHHIGKGNLMADWPACWRTWCDNQVKFGRATGKPFDQQGEPPIEMTGGF